MALETLTAVGRTIEGRSEGSIQIKRGDEGLEPWSCFVITGPGDRGGIVLEQVDSRLFLLGSTIEYLGETGLDLNEDAESRLRSVSPETLVETDLASVPGPFRWWANSYGVHTPAALIHDRFIGEPVHGQPGRPRGVSEQNIDRYFRFMLRQLGVPCLRSWLMWAAVASRTRMVSGPLRSGSMIAWFLCALVGLTALVVAVVNQAWPSAGIALLLPLPASALWGKQAGAGVIIAYVGVPFLLLPSLLAVPFLFLFAGLEAFTAQLIETARGLPQEAKGDSHVVR